MNWLWIVLGAAAVAAIGWHEVTEHHIVPLLLRRHVDPTPHHQAWNSIGVQQQRAIHAEMAVSAVLLASIVGLWPVIGLAIAALLTVTCVSWSLFHGQRAESGIPSESK